MLQKPEGPLTDGTPAAGAPGAAEVAPPEEKHVVIETCNNVQPPHLGHEVSSFEPAVNHAGRVAPRPLPAIPTKGSAIEGE